MLDLEREGPQFSGTAAAELDSEGTNGRSEEAKEGGKDKLQFTTEEEEFVVTKRAISAAQGKLKEGRGRGNKKGRRRPRRRLNGKAVAVWIPAARIG